jgi:3-oxoacyl-[acyl-carrier-protein] synthase-3
MKGTRIFRRAPMDMANAVKELLERNNLAYNDIKWFLPHQANQNINVLSASILGSEIYQNPGEPIKTTDARWLANIENYGNLSAGTIPILLHDNIKNGNIQRGDLCVTVGFGAGLNWGSVLFRY